MNIETLFIRSHAALSSFPIGLLFLLIFFEVWAPFSEAIMNRLKVIISSLLFAFYLLTFFSGYGAQSFASQSFEVSNELVEYHHQIGRVGLFAAGALFFCAFAHAYGNRHRRKVQYLYRGLLILTTGLCVYSNALGGDLVFSHGAGVSVGDDALGPLLSK